MDKKTFSSVILKYWYFLEFIGQPDFPAQSRSGKDECNESKEGKSKRKQISVFETVNYGDLFAESSEMPRLRTPGEIIKSHDDVYKSHPVVSDEVSLCMGKEERSLFAEKLRQMFAPDLDFPEKNRHSVGLVGLKCTSEGQYVPRSLNISPLAWGVHRLLVNKDEAENADLLSIESYKSHMEQLEKMLLTEEDGKEVGKVLTVPLLKSLTEQIFQQYFFSFRNSASQICGDSVLISQRYTTEDVKAEDTETYHESELSRSFFAADLEMTADALDGEKFGSAPMEQALLDYICSPYAREHSELSRTYTSQRTDIFDWEKQGLSSQEDFFHDCFDISRSPRGKWPSRFLPGLMQQLAINSSWKVDSGNPRIFSVNGPPGTGKTTLLKEIIAGNVVERAYKLAQYSLPDEAFEERHFRDGDEKNNGYSRFCNAYFSFSDDSLKDYGMLVASCNNAAVENITKELPDANALLKGLAYDQEDDPAIASGLKTVHELFDPSSADTEVYLSWNPESSKLEAEEIPDIYFTKLANDLAANNSAGKGAEKPNRWGLISAPFGKSSNLKNYIYKVLKPYIKSFGRNDFIEAKQEKYPQAAKRFLDQYRKVEALENELSEISGARAWFLERRKEFDKKASIAENERKAAERAELQLLENIRLLDRTIEQTKQELSRFQDISLDLQDQAAAQKSTQRTLEAEVEDIKKQIIELEQGRRFWDVLLDLFNRPTMLSKTIQEKYDALEKAKEALQKQKSITDRVILEYDKQRNSCRIGEEKLFDLQATHWKLEDERLGCHEKQKQLLDVMETCRRDIEEAQECYKSIIESAAKGDSVRRMTVLNEEFFALYNSENESESCKAHVSNPWQVAEYNREREKLFFEALQLHKAFLLASKCCLWNFKNLLLLWNEPRDDDEKQVKISKRDREAAFGDLFNTVFLLTPVISTTFASAGTMLSSIRTPGEIGCLIIDEAGQASPQMAVGSLFRSRRAIVVGDPKQVEPVVTDELDLIKRIIRTDDTRCYQDKSLSVQGFADSLNRIGTYYTDGPEELWVGCPLVVHRRCISPMFDISNALSYNHIMKQQTALPSPEKEATFCKDNSGWIQVCGSEKNTAGKDHFVEAQGKKAWEMILTAFDKADGIPSLFVITPFTSVRDGLKNMIHAQPECRVNPLIREWADKCIGTVHTFQGKEADQVIFLLGCDKNSISAVKWVNTNIVNVAATRAKYRLYVIGDYLVWKESAIFCKVKSILDSYAIRALYEISESPEMADRKQVEALLKQTPDADSLTMEGAPEEQLLSPLVNELSSILQKRTLKQEEWSAFGLSQRDLEQLPESIRNRLAQGILQHSIFDTVKNRYKIELKDASGAGILFCKVMETLLKDQFFEKFKAYFSTVKAFAKPAQKSRDKVTVGAFTNILNEESCRSVLADKKVCLFESPCDLVWWDKYAEHLDAFRDLRNCCCHSEPFGWDRYEQMLRILFEHREFMNTLVGDQLPL